MHKSWPGGLLVFHKAGFCKTPLSELFGANLQMITYLNTVSVLAVLLLLAWTACFWIIVYSESVKASVTKFLTAVLTWLIFSPAWKM